MIIERTTDRRPVITAILVVIAALNFDTLAQSAKALPEPLDSPDRGVVCNRRTDVCYDRFGPSIGLTEIFGGHDAAQRLLMLLRKQPANQAEARFAPAEGAVCIRETGPCFLDGELHPGLTTALYQLRS